VETRVIAYGGNAIAVEGEGPRAARIVEFVYGYAPTGGHTAPFVTYRIREIDGEQRLELLRDGVPCYSSRSDAALADMLMGDSCRRLVERSRGGLMFHAAALTHAGRCLVLPGTIGAGKSTLTAWLISRNFGYLTDELVFVPSGSDTIQVFTRPLNLKRPSHGPLQGYFDYQQRPGMPESDGPVWSTAFNDLIAPATLGVPAGRPEPVLDVVILPQYASGAHLDLRRLTKAQAGLAMMQCLVNARNLAGHGFEEVARLARRVPTYALRYSRFEDLGARIEELLRSA
jgi:hypothetical protein